MARTRARELPGPNILELGTPLVIYKGRLFQPDGEEGGENYFMSCGRRYSLEEIARPSELERLYFEHNKRAVEDYQRNYIREFSSREFNSRESIERMLSQNKTLALIAEKILPVITGQQEESRLMEAAGGGRREEAGDAGHEREVPEQMRRELAGMKRDLVGKVVEEYERYKTRASYPLGGEMAALTDSALYDFLSYNPYLIEGKRVYELMKARGLESLFLDRSFVQTEQRERLRRASSPDEAKEILTLNKPYIESRLYSKLSNVLGSMHFKIEGSYYYPVLAGDAEEFSKSYRRFLEKRAKIEAIEQDEEHNLILYKMAEKRKSLEQMASRREYELNNAGFRVVNGDYYVFVRTPPYALRSPHTSAAARYVAFGPAEVGVRISSSGNEFNVEAPIVMNSYMHPFLSSNSAMQRICLGSWGANSSYYRQSPEERAILLLDQGKKTLMMGYGTGNNPYHRLNRDYFSNWLTKEEVMRQGLVVLNEVGR